MARALDKDKNSAKGNMKKSTAPIFGATTQTSFDVAICFESHTPAKAHADGHPATFTALHQLK